MGIMATRKFLSLDVLFYAHNQENFVTEALNSIILQRVDSSVSLRLLIIDDGSSDSTLNKIQSVLDNNREKLSSRKVLVEIRHRNGGAALGQTATFQEGLRWAAGDYFAVLEGDDYWSDVDHLSTLIKVLQDKPDISVAFSSWTARDSQGRYLSDRVPTGIYLRTNLVDMRSILRENPPATLSACLYRTSQIIEVRHLLLKITNLADWGTNLLLSHFGPLYWSPKKTLVYRYLPNSLWRKKSGTEKISTMVKLLNEYYWYVEPDKRYLVSQEIHRLKVKKIFYFFRSRTKLSR